MMSLPTIRPERDMVKNHPIHMMQNTVSAPLKVQSTKKYQLF